MNKINYLVDVNIIHNNLNQSYSYKTDLNLYNELNYGDLILVEFNNVFKIGFVVNKENKTNQSMPKYNLKNVIKILKKNKYGDELFKKIQYTKKKIYANERDIINLIISKNSFNNKTLILKKNQENDKIIQELFIKYKSDNEIKLSKISKQDNKLIINLVNDNKIDIELENNQKKIEVFNYSVNYIKNNKLKKISDNLLRKKDFINFYNITEYKFQKLKKEQKIESSNILSEEYNYIKKKDLKLLKLNNEQEKAYKKIKNTEKISLLHGVTGSGKTLVYLKIIKDEINRGNQVLILVPEINLTVQMIEQIKYFFNDQVDILTNQTTSKQKKKILKNIYENKTQIIIGTRSTIFINIPKLTLVIVDEEHDSSYKQNFYPYYHINIMYEYWFSRKIKIILGSATPSILSYVKGIKKKYELVELKNRYKEYLLPKINFTTYEEEKLLTLVTKDVDEILKSKEKALILFNVKGYSRNLLCSYCGKTLLCPNCNIPLKYYKFESKLECNFCGFEEKYKKKCNSCGKENSFLDKGIGIEKIVELLNSKFNGKILHVDSKISKTKNKFQDIINDFKTSNSKILVGTQIISKGFNFPGLKNVIVLNLDSNLYFEDFSIYESTYQLLEQISGRPGRDSNQGKVKIYTNNEEHFVYRSIQKHDYKLFFNEEIINRKLQKAMPYYFICQIEVRGNEVKKLENLLKTYTQKMENIYIVSSIVVPFIEKLNGQYRRKIYIRYKKENLKNNLEEIENSINLNGITLLIDLDITSYGY